MTLRDRAEQVIKPWRYCTVLGCLHNNAEGEWLLRPNALKSWRRR